MEIKCFGIAKEITASSSLKIDGAIPGDVKSLKEWLKLKYPAFNNINNCLIAVNQEYAEDTVALYPTDEIAIIPPVSGG